MSISNIRPSNNGRTQRAQNKVSYADSDEELKEDGKQVVKVSRTERLKQRYFTKDISQSDSGDEGISSFSDEETSKRDDEWDDECYICKKDGDVLCCETCSRVCHFKCTELKQKPAQEWYC